MASSPVKHSRLVYSIAHIGLITHFQSIFNLKSLKLNLPLYPGSIF